MNKIPNENWQSYMLRNLCAEETIILLPEWCGRFGKAIARVFGGLFILAFFCAIPALAWEIACALIDALY